MVLSNGMLGKRTSTSKLVIINLVYKLTTCSGNTVVIINKNNYKTKVKAMLSDLRNAKFKKI